MSEDLNKYHFLRLEEATKPPKDFIIYNYQNKWWLVHPERGLAFYRKGFSSPQCNSNRQVLENMKPSWAKIQFIEQSFAPCDVNDYRE